MATTRPPPEHASLFDSFRRLIGWMRANGAPLLVDNLAPGVSPAQLVKLQGKLGFMLPSGLRAMWLLHDGQRKPLNGFVGPLHLLPVAWVLNERVRTQSLLARLRARPGDWADLGVTADEAGSDAWLPFAARGPTSLVVHAVSGRVFAGDLDDDAAPLALVADSVPQWLASYADSVEAGEFELLSGHGDYHLAPIDPELDAAEAPDET